MSHDHSPFILKDFEVSQAPYQFLMTYAPLHHDFGPDIFFRHYCEHHHYSFCSSIYEQFVEQGRKFQVPQYPSKEAKYKFLAITDRDHPRYRKIHIDFLKNGLEEKSSILSIRGSYEIDRPDRASYTMRLLEKNIPHVQRLCENLEEISNPVVRGHTRLIENFVQRCVAATEDHLKPTGS